MAAPPVVNWQEQILKRVGAPVTPQNLLFVNDWSKAEGGGATNNPFNTTQPAAGASSYNSVGVRNYLTPQQGIQATVQTLENGRYGNILSALKQGTDARAAASALAASPWGTGSLVEKMIGSGGSPAPSSAAAPVPHAVASSLHAQAAPTAPAQAAGGSPIFAALQLLGFDTPQQTLGVTQPQVPQPTAPKPQQPVAQPAQQSALTSHISQTGPVEQLPFVGNTAGVKPTLLQQVSQAAQAAGATQIRITSGARSAAHNQAVGGVQGSNHLTGDALDGYGLVNGQWVPLGQLLLKTASRYGLRSGDVPGFFNGGTDPVHVDDGANQAGRR